MSDWQQMLRKMIQNAVQQQLTTNEPQPPPIYTTNKSQPNKHQPTPPTSQNHETKISQKGKATIQKDQKQIPKKPRYVRKVPQQDKKLPKLIVEEKNLNSSITQEVKYQVKPSIKEIDSTKTKYFDNQQPMRGRFERTQMNKFNDQQPEYENKCYQLLKNYEKIEENDEDLTLQIRNLKRYIFNTELIQRCKQKPSQITLYRSLDYPVLFLGYLYKQEKRYMPLRDIQKSIRNKIGEYHQIIKKIYDMYFYPVDLSYQQALTKFAQIKARQIRVKLATKKIFRQGQKQISTLLYYCLNKNRNGVNLIYFDLNMVEISLGESFIKQNKEIYPENFQVFMKFVNSVRGQTTIDMIGIGQEEVQSDQQDHQLAHFKKEEPKSQQKKQDIIKTIRQTEKRLREILVKDLTKLEDHLQKINEKLIQITKTDYRDNEKASKLQEQVDLLNRNIQNFKDVRSQIEESLKKVSKQDDLKKLHILKAYLKRMILAEKHLESKLPILAKKHQIFDRLNKDSLIIIEGQTGSGKSTQLPQLLCQYYKLFEDPKSRPVLITQPRKIATRSLAERVAQQMEQKIGYFVDYAASSTTQVNPQAKIVFKLDRLILDEFVQSPTLDNYSCLVIDEAHERTISIDVILGLTKELLKQRKDFKVIVTSASMEISRFEKYFKAKTLKVSGRQFPVQIMYEPSREEDVVLKIQKVINNQLLTYNKHLKDDYKGHILVFCSDTSQINRLCKHFSEKLNSKLFLVLPLHGKLQPEEQKKVFIKSKQHKLIFASRIAQTAITIDGVKVVIDPGLDRQMHYDQNTKFSSMRLVEISQSSAKQRAGRAGRTQAGYCFRLYSKPQLDNRTQNKRPEIKNMALDTLVLRLKALRIKNIFDFEYIQTPDQKGMVQSLQLLKMIGCLDTNENITSIGQFLVKIPIEPFLARSIIEGLILEKTISIYPKFQGMKREYAKSIIEILCMILNANNLFRFNQHDKQRLEFIKYEKFSHQMGDFFFLKKIYEQFLYNLSRDKSIYKWFQEHFLIGKTLYQIKQLVFEIHQITKHFVINEDQMSKQILKSKQKLEKYIKQDDLILSCLTTSFCSNICLFSGHPLIGYTYMTDKKTVSIYGTSCLSLLGITPKWILVYDLYENKAGKAFCKIANAISFQFLKDTVDPYVFKKFNLAQAQKENPFFKQINLRLPTLVLSRIKTNYEKRTDEQLFKDFTLHFNEAQNKLTAFIMYLAQENLKIDEDRASLDSYINKLRKDCENSYLHNYVGNIFVQLSDGIEVRTIQFAYHATVFEITQMDAEVYQNLAINWEGPGRVDVFGREKVKITVDSVEEVKFVDSFIDFLQTRNQKKFDVKKQLLDSRRKIPQTKIYLHWWAGTDSRNHVLLSYPSRQELVQTQKGLERRLVQTAPKHLQYIEDALRNVEAQNYQHQGKRKYKQRKSSDLFGRLRLTRKGNCINVNQTNLDQIEISRYLTKLIKQNKIDPEFQLPSYIMKFRQPDISEGSKNDQVWIQQIRQLISALTRKGQNCIRVWGRKYIPRQEQKISNKIRKQLSSLENSLRIEMHAEIKTFDIKLLKKMTEDYEGKKFILGCEKMHINSMFDQVIAVVDPKVLNYLKDQFNYYKQNFERQYQTIQFDIIERKNRRNQGMFSYMIIARSQNREDLLEPIRVLGQLFTPKFIVVQDREFRFLDKSEGGQRILQWVEEEFQFRVHFSFDRYQKKIKLYCHDSLAKNAENKLRYYLAQNKDFNQMVCYKGKNLKRIERAIKQKQQQLWKKNNKNKSLCYQIIFTARKVFVSGDFDTLEWVKKQIQQVQVHSNKSECQICNDIMNSPYELFNCGHTFCWYCLASEIREFKHQSETKLLRCSYVYEDTEQVCGKLVNINDVATILSEAELQKIADVKIGKFVEQNRDKYFQCLSPNCEQIFPKEDLQKEDQIDCQLCGKFYCLLCKQSHKNYSCEQWKARNVLTENNLKDLNIKACPKCKKGIEKDKGCNHVACRCGAHICWKCLTYFNYSNDCYDHLAKKCGGIFDPDSQFQ